MGAPSHNGALNGAAAGGFGTSASAAEAPARLPPMPTSRLRTTIAVARASPTFEAKRCRICVSQRIMRGDTHRGAGVSVVKPVTHEGAIDELAHTERRTEALFIT